MKTLRILIPLVVLALLGFTQARAQVTADLKVRNQRIVGSTYFFDVYIERTGSNDLFLGNSDFVLTFDNTNFSSPSFSYVSSSAALKNTGGSAITSYESNIATSVGTGLSANRLIINVQPPAFSNQSTFDANIAKIDDSDTTHFLGTFSVTGMQNASTFPNLQWKTSGTGIITKVFTLASSTSWRSTAATVTGVNPTLGTEPTQASALTVIGTTSTTLTLDVEEGGGTDRIILAKAGSAVGSDGPADGISYTANAAFGSGDEIGASDVFVVYKGSDTTVTVTGLSAGITYHFAAYEFNGSDGTSENFNTTSPPTVSSSTLAAEPTVQASAVYFTSPTSSGLTINFDAGDGSNRLVLVKEAGAVNGTPVDGTTYTASTTFESGTQIGTGNYVVYNGTDTTVAVTGLDPNTVYHVAVYEFNGSSGSENYLTTSPATGDRTTLQAEPTVQASSLIVNGPTTTTLNLTWTNGNGARTIVVAKSGSAVDVNPTDGAGYTAGSFTAGDDLGSGNIVVYDGTDTTTTVTDLNANTTYHFAVYEYNGTTLAQNYLTSGPATGNGTTTQSEPTVQASNVSFGTYSTTSLVINFDAGNGSNRLVLVKSGSAVDASPTDATGYTADAAFGSGTEIGTGNYVVYGGTDTTVTVTGLTANTVYHVAVFEFNGSSGTENYMTSGSGNTGNRTTLHTELATQVTTFTAANPTASTIDLSWSGGDGTRRIIVAKAGSAVSVNPTDGITYTAGSFAGGQDLGSGNIVVYDGTGTSATVTALSQNTTYHFAIYVYQGTGGAENYNVTNPKTANENTYMSLAVTTFLEGPYNGTDMDTTLKANGDLPLSQPFNASPWSYSGNESVASIPNNVVDWVLIELRKSGSGAANATSDSVEATVAGFLLRNGTIVATDGSSALNMPIDESGTYYVVVYHRNHLPVMSSSAITSNGTNYTYNFTTGSSQAYGTNAQIDMGSGVYGLYSGRVENTTADDIDAADRSAAWSARNSTGYQVTDCTLDGLVDAADRSTILNNSGKSSQVP